MVDRQASEALSPETKSNLTAQNRKAVLGLAKVPITSRRVQQLGVVASYDGLIPFPPTYILIAYAFKS
jgi:hypothetical protein